MLRKDAQRLTKNISSIVGTYAFVQRTDGLNVVLGRVEVGGLQMVLQQIDVVLFVDDRNISLRSPCQHHLRRGLVRALVLVSVYGE